MSYSILSVYLLLSASVRHQPFRSRSNPALPLSIQSSLPLFSLSSLLPVPSRFSPLFHSPSTLHLFPPCPFSTFSPLLSLPGPLTSWASGSLVPRFPGPPVLWFPGPLRHTLSHAFRFGWPSRIGRRHVGFYDPRSDCRTCGVLFCSRFLRCGFFYRCFFCDLRFGFFGYGFPGGFGR